MPLFNSFTTILVKIIALLSIAIGFFSMLAGLPSYPLNQSLMTQRSSEQLVLQENQKSMLPEAIRSVIQQASKAWVSGDANAFAKLFAPDGELIVHGKRWVGSAKIQEEAARFSQTYAVKIDIKRIIVEGNQAVVEWFWEEIEKVTGKRSQADDAIVIDFKNGQICRWREYIDTDTPVQTNQQ